MEEQFITPMQPLEFKPLSLQNQNTFVKGKDGVAIFNDLMKQMVNNATAAERDYQQKEYMLATGQIEDAHTVPVAGAYAQLTVDMLVAFRNKALESFNELMRVNI